MSNTTKQTKELLLKLNLHFNAAPRKMLCVIMLLCGLLSAFLILGDYLIDSFHTLAAGFFFLPIALISGFVLFQISKAKISEKIQKQISNNPDTVVKYYFDQEHFTVETTSQYRHSSERVDYALIEKTVKIDDKTMYMATKTGFCYVIYEENGISELFRYLYMRTRKPIVNSQN